jgi:hypothetical protein
MAAAFFAVNVFQIRIAWEMRIYAMGEMFVLMSICLLFIALYIKPAKWLYWVLYAVSISVCMYTHYATVFVIFGQAIFIGIHVFDEIFLKKKPVHQTCLKYAAGATGISIFLFAPWMPTFFHQRQIISQSWWDAPFSWNQPFEILPRLFIPDTVYEIASYVSICIWAGLIVCSLIVLCVYRKTGLLIFLAGPVALLLMILQSMFGTNLMVDRFLSYVQIFLIIILAMTIAGIPWHFWRDIIAVDLVLCGMDTYCIYIEKLNIPSAPGARGAVDFIRENWLPGDRVVASCPLYYSPILFYLGPDSGTQVYDENGGGFAHFCGQPVVRANDVITSDRMRRIDGKRVWVVTSSGGWGSNFPFSIPQNWQKGSLHRKIPDLGAPSDYVVQLWHAHREVDADGETRWMK